MSEDRSDIKLDGSTALWEMKADGVIHGTYMGTFRFRCYLSPLQQIAAGREERELLGTNIALAPEHERFLAYALSQLKYRVITAPPFWSSANPNGNLAGDVADEEIVSAVLDAAINAEVMYKKELKKRRDSAIERAKTLGEQMNKQVEEDAEDKSDDDNEEEAQEETKE